MKLSVVKTVIAKSCLGAASLIVCVTACSSTAGPVPLEVIHQSPRCAVPKAQIKLLKPEEVSTLIQGRRALNLSLNGGPSVGNAASTSAEPVQLAANEQAILIAWGTKPSGGYQLSLAASEAVADDGVLELPVSFVAPGPGQLTTQALTSPCLILKSSLPEDVRILRAGDLSLAL